MRPRAALAVALLWIASGAMASPAGDALTQAETALSRGDGLAAETALERAAKAGASSGDIAALRGEAAFLQGDIEEARRYLVPARLNGPYRVRGLRVLARVEQQHGDIDAAAAALQLALRSAGDRADIWTDIARLRYAAGNHTGAIEAIDLAVGLDDAGPAALLYKGQLVRDATGLKAALPWFERALEQAPDDMVVMGEYAATLADLGRASDALDMTRRMLELDRRSAQAFFVQALIAARAQKYALARRLMARTGDTLEDWPAAMLLSGILETRSGASRLGSEKLFDLYDIAPALASDALAEALLADGDPVELEARFKRLSAVRQTSPVLAWQLVRSAEQRGDYGEAARAFDTAAAWSWGGAVRRGQASEIARWSGAYAADPANIGIAAAYVRSLVAGNRSGQALSVARDLVRVHPGNYASQLALGDAALANGDPRRALDAYRVAASIRRGPQLARKLALAHLDAGDIGGARSVLARYIEQNPLDREVPTFLGTLMLRTGDAAGAAQLLKATWPEARRDPLGLARLAWAQLQSGDGEAALANARIAYAMQRSSVAAAIVLAAALEAAQSDPGAIAALRAKTRGASLDDALQPLFAL